MNLRPLPQRARSLCEELEAPPRLIAHLTLVHDAACDLVEAIAARFPMINIDSHAVEFGAATHDLGKTIYRGELTSRGTAHEAAGEELLLGKEVSPDLARFARTHANWRGSPITLEDLLVALVDAIWKGRRIPDLESEVAHHIAQRSGNAEWETWSALDDLIQRIASKADDRLAWQQSHST
jgi:hypothetical protein